MSELFHPFPPPHPILIPPSPKDQVTTRASRHTGGIHIRNLLCLAHTPAHKILRETSVCPIQAIQSAVDDFIAIASVKFGTLSSSCACHSIILYYLIVRYLDISIWAYIKFFQSSQLPYFTSRKTDCLPLLPPYSQDIYLHSAAAALMSVDRRHCLICLRYPARYQTVSRSQLSKAHTGDSNRPIDIA